MRAHQNGDIEHVFLEYIDAQKRGWDPCVPSDLTPKGLYERNGVYVPLRIALDLAAQLETRPRTEFVAVGWWDGKQALFEPDVKPERGALLFRPLSDQSDSAP